jgi:transcriptional regulator with XRE-family HTH domain
MHRNGAHKHGIGDPDYSNSRRTLAARIGLRLAASRREAGLTQGDLAQKAGLQTWTISRYEMGTSTPPVQALDAMATVLAVSVDYLLSREPPATLKGTDL